MERPMVTMINVYAPPESHKTFFDVIAVEMDGILICGGTSMRFEIMT